MTITVVFDSLEEFKQHFGATCAPVEPVKVWEPELQKPAVSQEEPKAKEKPKKAEKPAEKPAEVPEVPFAEDKKEEPAVTTEQIRKQLADLNKKAGENVAKMLIKQVGYKKLTDVPEGALPTLQALVEEEAAKYE